MRQCFRISRWSSVGTGVVGTVNPHSTLQYSLLIRNVTNAVINAVLYSVVLWIARSLMPSHIAQPTLSPPARCNSQNQGYSASCAPYGLGVPRVFLTEWGKGSDTAASSVGQWG